MYGSMGAEYSCVEGKYGHKSQIINIVTPVTSTMIFEFIQFLQLNYISDSLLNSWSHAQSLANAPGGAVRGYVIPRAPEDWVPQASD